MSKIHPLSVKKNTETEQIKIEKFQHLDLEDINENKIFENSLLGFPTHLFRCKKDYCKRRCISRRCISRIC